MTRTPEPMISYAEDTGPPALLIAGGAAGDAEAAVALLGGRIVAHAGWDEVADALTDRSVRPVLLLESEGVEDGLLAAGLARVDAHASALDLHIVVALDETQIDLVAAHMLGPRVQLLCAPAIQERGRRACRRQPSKWSIPVERHLARKRGGTAPAPERGSGADRRDSGETDPDRGDATRRRDRGSASPLRRRPDDRRADRSARRTQGDPHATTARSILRRGSVRRSGVGHAARPVCGRSWNGRGCRCRAYASPPRSRRPRRCAGLPR